MAAVIIRAEQCLGRKSQSWALCITSTLPRTQASSISLMLSVTTFQGILHLIYYSHIDVLVTFIQLFVCLFLCWFLGCGGLGCLYRLGFLLCYSSVFQFPWVVHWDTLFSCLTGTPQSWLFPRELSDHSCEVSESVSRSSCTSMYKSVKQKDPVVASR